MGNFTSCTPILKEGNNPGKACGREEKAKIFTFSSLSPLTTHASSTTIRPSLPSSTMIKHIHIIINLISTFGFLKGDFEFVSTGGMVSGVEGERNVILPCAVTADPQSVMFQWTLDSHVVTEDGRRSQVGSNLHFSRILRTLDSGEFRCVVTELETGFSRTSPPIRINHIWLSESAQVRLIKPRSGNFELGQEVILECHVEGSLEIRFQWNKNGDSLEGNGKRLKLGGANLDLGGSYCCEGSSDAGTVSSEYFHLFIPEGNVPENIIFPASQIVPLNSVVRLDCFGQNLQVNWIFEGTRVQNNSRFSILPNGTLLLQKLSQRETGLYKCQTQFNLVYSANIQIASIDPLTSDFLLPKPWHLTQEQLGFAAGSKVEIYCAPPTGNPRPKISWEGPSLMDTRRNSSLNLRNGDTLLFPSVSLSDEGRYTCRAENVAGASAVGFKLVITKPPRLISQPQGLDGDEHDVAVFRCPFSGSPYPTTRVTWTHNQGPMRHAHANSKHHHRITNVEQNGTLVIEGLKVEDHGAYACQVLTQGHAPINSREALLRVRERLKFVSRPVDRRLEVGSTYKIPCKAQGDPPPLVTWVKVGGANFDWPSHIVDEKGILHFNAIEKRDSGYYTCLATNKQGILNATIHIHVFASPRFVVTPRNPTEAIEGQSLRMDCKAEGDPLPTIKWDQDRDASMITNDRFLLFENGSLFIRQVTLDDHGHRFGCTAGNSGGFKREEVEIIVASNDDFVSAEQSGVMTRTVWITLSVAAGYMLLVVGLMLWCRFRQIRRKATYLADIRAELVETELKDGLVESVRNEMTPKTTNTRAESLRSDDGETGKSTHSSVLGSAQPKTGSGAPSLASHRSHTSSQSKRSYEDMSGERKDLQFVMLLGHGTFGEVFLAKGIVAGAERLLMVKALQIKEGGALAEFRREIDMFTKVKHENVSSLVRLCREMDPHYLIMEYSDWGDLKQFLLATRTDHPRTPKPPPLTPYQIVKVLCEVAQGMDHLASLRFVHKDLAARNCLVSSGLRIQVSNPSLSRDTYANEYSLFRNTLVPVRWLSPEALLEDDYSTKSDTWAFGCLLWEVSHQAELPWQRFKETDLIGQWERKESPNWDLNSLPPNLVTLLKEVTDLCPSKRPTFTEVVEKLSNCRQ